ncbi:MAG TPA: zf-HC2 domain-containing protein [Gemmatimonadales bacterium]|nr:zf-HC2 domain-containing protein [Gemmatimonadales bacterium]
MPHLDDATIHTLLDRELDTAEQQAVESHLAVCEQCAARVAEERSIVSGAEELIASLEGESSSGKWGAGSGEEEVRGEKGEVRREAGGEAVFLHPSAEPKQKGSPVVLVPERAGAGFGRRRWPLAAAALLLVTAGAGWLVFRPKEPTAVAVGAESLGPDTVSDAEADAMSAAIMNDPAGVPTAGATYPDTMPPDTSLQVASAPPPAAARAAVDTPATQESTRSLPIDLAVGITSGSSSTADAQQARLRAEAAEAARAESTTLAIRESLLAASRARDSLAQLARRRADDSARQARALREAERRDVAEVALEAPPQEAPPPRPVARPTAGAAAVLRDEVTTRERIAPAQRLGPIGLDEAADMLGQPVHVIDGLRFNSVSLVPASTFPGSDQSRPVVRVTYLGVDGATIYLDQQRALDGSGEGDTEEVFRASGWYIGNVRLRLTGDVTYDSLAVLVGKVR